jgi:glycerol uptake facilitator-like aquaporin
VTLARAVSDTFVGIRPADVPGFLAAQVLGAAAATAVIRWLVPPLPMPTVVPVPETKALGTRSPMPTISRPSDG